MSTEIEKLSVTILDKQYHVNCHKDETDDLNNSAKLLDEKMRQIRDSGKVLGIEKVAVMAALNLAHELMLLTKSYEQDKEKMDKTLSMMHDKVKSAVTRNGPAIAYE